MKLNNFGYVDAKEPRFIFYIREYRSHGIKKVLKTVFKWKM